MGKRIAAALLLVLIPMSTAAQDAPMIDTEDSSLGALSAGATIVPLATISLVPAM